MPAVFLVRKISVRLLTEYGDKCDYFRQNGGYGSCNEMGYWWFPALSCVCSHPTRGAPRSMRSRYKDILGVCLEF